MKLRYLIKYIYSFLFQKNSNLSKTYLVDYVKRSSAKSFWEKIAGNFFNFFDRKIEKRKIKNWSKKKKSEQEKLIYEIIKKSKSFILNLTIAFLCFWVFDLTFNELFHQLLNKELVSVLPDDFENLVEEFLKFMIPTLSAFIALIFSLYGVVTQVVMDKYSTSVTKYINEDKFSNLFLRSLVFINIFATLLYIRAYLFQSTPITISFLFVIFALCLTLLSLLLFKDSYTYSVKPENLFRRLGNDILEQIDIVAGLDPSVKNSRSIIFHSGERVRSLLNIFESLYDDLIRDGNVKDINQAPIALSVVFLDYIEKRKLIDEDKSLWFPKINRPFDGDTYIKVNYEIQGKGSLYMPAPHKEWFENRIKEMFSLMTRKISVVNEDTYSRCVIQSYQSILAGERVQNQYGVYDTKIHGAYEGGELGIFKMFYEEFLKLSEYFDIKSESYEFDYINSLFVTGIVLIDENEKILKEVRTFLEGVVKDQRLIVTHDDIRDISFPKYIHVILSELIDSLKVEIVCEGRVITPASFFINEVLEKIKAKSELDSQEYFGSLLKDIHLLIKKEFKSENYQRAFRFIELELRFFQRLVYINKFDLVDQHKEIIKDIQGYVMNTPTSELMKTDLFDIVEQLIFPIALAGKKDILNHLTVILLFLLRFVYMQKINKPEDKVLLMRTLVIIGGFLFILCEFEEDLTLLEIYKTNLSIYYPDTFKILSLIESFRKNDTFLSLSINKEVNVYNRWFGVIYGKIDKLPKKLFQTKTRFGMSNAADHPSDLIKEMSLSPILDVEKCNQKFIEWIEEDKKRELMFMFIGILRNKSLLATRKNKRDKLNTSEV